MELRYGTPAAAGMLPTRVEHAKALARGWVEDGVHPALVVLAARRGVIFLHEAYGKLRPDVDSPPLAKDSIFPMASATKPITAACVLLLVEEGKVGLMRPVRDYFPEITGAGTEEVLVHHLLTHLSGWRDPDVFGEEASRRSEAAGPARAEAGQNEVLAEFLRDTCKTPLAHRPGEAFQYCQLNFELLADLVRRASGSSIEDFARERIFEPLGMHSTSYVLPPEQRPRKVYRSPGMAGTQYVIPWFPGIDSEAFEGMSSGAGGVHSTASDYAIFAQMLLNGGRYGGNRILSRASVEAMRRNQLPEGAPELWDIGRPDGQWISVEIRPRGGYGYGLAVFLDRTMPYYNGGLASRSSFSHSGNWGVYWWADPDRDLVGVYLSVADVIPGTAFMNRRIDLFVDSVTAAVDE